MIGGMKLEIIIFLNEAIDTKAENIKRIIKEITVIDTFIENNEALKKYIHLTESHPNC